MSFVEEAISDARVMRYVGVMISPRVEVSDEKEFSPTFSEVMQAAIPFPDGLDTTTQLILVAINDEELLSVTYDGDVSINGSHVGTIKFTM